MSAFQGHSATKQQVAELFHILSVMRPHKSGMEAKFIKHYLHPLKPQVDDCGNHIVRVGKNSPVVWSCHVDTVHNYGGLAPIKLHDDGLIKVHPRSRANCLGADDGSGVWLMLQMIRAKRPGLYIFHRGEERGGIGSKWIAKNTPELLTGIECAIAFDRKDVGSIITHQWGGRCCSEDFSDSLSKAIGLGMKSDSTGSFTDTASYTDIVGECTNVSVGYKWQHGKTEEQNLPFLLSLLDRMLDVDAKDLVYKRKPGEKEKSRGRGSNWSWARDRDSDNYSDIHGGRSSYAYSPKYSYQQGKTWSQFHQGYVWPEDAAKIWDEAGQSWIKLSEYKGSPVTWNKGRMEYEPVPKDKGEKGARAFMDSSKRHCVARFMKRLNSVQRETFIDLIKDYPEEIAEILRKKQYGFGYLHEEIRKAGGILETKYIETSEGVCSNCQRLETYCSCDPDKEICGSIN